MTKTSNAEAAWFIHRRKEFITHTQSLSGEWEQLSISPGRLPEPWASDLRRLVEDTVNVYVVYSYVTPIAWWSAPTDWVIPSLTYSSTTSRHQAIVRKATAPAQVP